MPYRRHLSSSASLVTSYEKVRAGFVALALERNRRATPFVDQARVLKTDAATVSTPAQLLNFPKIRKALLAAAGISDKAAGYMNESDKTEAIQGLVREFLEPAKPDFVEELVYRFLLTRGDTLGGSMRNIGGVLATRKFTRTLLAILTLAGIPYHWFHSSAKTWIPMSENDAGIELNFRGLSWSIGGQDRTLFYNLNVPLVRKNVDVCLLNCSYREFLPITIENPSAYLALGELKGGIDPAGADEHWKTANSALGRIRTAFSAQGLTPGTFFLGAAIADSMAEEVWSQLENGTLTNAANATDEAQTDSLCEWLCNY
ncbi:MAG: restriction endonuclease [Leptolyngbyaceae cyanobacterium CRU_2_3]|nr:restriction endonuclease [Leptolyngbyaceae cyanobacterium CRU_2_3]